MHTTFTMIKTILFISILVGLVFQSTPTKGQTLPVEVFGKLPEKSTFILSPSGNRMAYRDTKGGNDIITVVDIAANEIVDAVNVSNVKPNSLYFVGDDRLIMLVTQNKKLPGFRGRHEISAAFSYDLETRKLFQLLTLGKGIYLGQSQIGRIVGISEDQKYAYMPAYGNENILNLYRVRLDKIATPRIHKRGSHGVIDYFMDGDEVVARERFDNKSNKHVIHSYITGEQVEIFKNETEIANNSFVGLTPDKQYLVMTGMGETGRWEYYTLSLQDGSIDGPLFSKEDRDVELAMTDSKRIVHGVQYSGFKPTYEFFDKKLNARIKGINQALPEFASKIQSYTPDWKKIILHSFSADNSGSYIMYSNGGLSLVAAERPEITPQYVNEVIEYEYEYEARDGLTIPTLLTLPRNKELKGLPAILLPHGGPESYDRIGFDYMAQYFAYRGYLVIQPQFRGSTGFGIQHRLKGRGQWGKTMQDDLTDAVEALANEGKIDPKNVCIVGGSYGGYAALAGAAFTPDVYKCAISLNGVSDLDVMMKTERSNYGSNHWVVAYWDKVMANGNYKRNYLESVSPINFVSDIKIPVLLIHGEYDEIVPFKQSKNMYEEMKDEDKDVTFIELNNGDHFLSTAENRIKAMKAMSEFLDKHL